MSLALDIARAKLARERERLRRAAEPRSRPPPGVTWRPTPVPAENNLKALEPTAITMVKLWDRSPIDSWAFDPTQPPATLPDPPANTSPPAIIPLTDLVVGSQLVGQQGTWTGSPTYTRQWSRGGSALPGETGAAYTMTVTDVGAMIGCTVTATNTGGSTSPVEPAP